MQSVIYRFRIISVGDNDKDGKVFGYLNNFYINLYMKYGQQIFLLKFLYFIFIELMLNFLFYSIFLINYYMQIFMGCFKYLMGLGKKNFDVQ